MEGNFLTYQNVTPICMQKKIEFLINKVKKFKGNFVFLWHNQSFYGGNEYQKVYENILNEINKDSLKNK
ncbi:hypothetical protein MSIBF_A640005 [groundwater metagenome]|uniref:Uncharacterized protein n=1 Tax=groundwater metagenome TaxID=717931 RepID=A0A098EEG1_9ZZZZ